MTTNDKSALIASINDRFRTSRGHGIPGDLMMTAGVSALPSDDLATVLNKVRTFDDFTEGDDPYGEHDFGSFEHAGERFFWKIDYYAPDLQSGSEDPADLSKTVRVLTVHFASEW